MELEEDWKRSRRILVQSWIGGSVACVHTLTILGVSLNGSKAGIMDGLRAVVQSDGMTPESQEERGTQ